MNAVILAPYVRELGSKAKDGAIREWVQGLSATELSAWALAGLAGCALFAWIVYMLLRVFIPERRLPSATNTVLESMAVVCLFVVLGRGMGAALAVLECGDILVRLAGSIFTGIACVATLAALRLRRERESAFPWWDLRPYEGGLLLFSVMPLVFLAFMPINLAAGFAWRCVLVMCNRPTDLQDVLLAPLERGGAVIAVFMAATVLVVPIVEEILFRGALYRSLREDLGRGAAAFISSFVFALLHANEAAFVPLFLLSLLFVVAYERTGSLWACILLHACFNGVNFTLA